MERSVHLKRWSSLTGRSGPTISEILVSSPAPRHHTIAKMADGTEVENTEVNLLACVAGA